MIFERFLNPARSDRPDIDLDFCWRRRDEVVEHIYELFGRERTAMIATLNCFGLRAAFREAALAEGISPSDVNRWSRRLPHASFETDPNKPGGAINPIAHALMAALRLVTSCLNTPASLSPGNARGLATASPAPRP